MVNARTIGAAGAMVGTGAAALFAFRALQPSRGDQRPIGRPPIPPPTGWKDPVQGARPAAEASGIHIITAPHLSAMRQSSAAGAAKELFDNPDTYVAKFRDGQRFPEGWDSKRTLLYTSYEEFAQDARRGRIGDDIDAVVYDNEEWDRTPLAEREDPDTAARSFRDLAHANDLEFIAAPAPARPGTRLFDADAKYADILVAQVQGRQSNPHGYRAGIRAARAHLDRVNPDAKLVAELSSNPEKLAPSGIASDADTSDVRQAVRSATGPGAAPVDGIWPWTYSSTPAGLAHGVEMVRELAATQRAN